MMKILFLYLSLLVWITILVQSAFTFKCKDTGIVKRLEEHNSIY